MIPGYFDSQQAALWLGVSYSKFRKTCHPDLPSVQFHVRGPRLYKVEDLNTFRVLHLSEPGGGIV